MWKKVKPGTSSHTDDDQRDLLDEDSKQIPNLVQNDSVDVTYDDGMTQSFDEMSPTIN